MVDIGIPSTPSGADPVTAPRSGRSSSKSDGEGKGFFDVLADTLGGGKAESGKTESGNEHGHVKDDAAASARSAQDDSALDESALISGQSRQTKPLIDLQKTSLRQQLPQNYDEVAAGQKQASKAGRNDGKNTKDLVEAEPDQRAEPDAKTAGDATESKDSGHIAKTAKDSVAPGDGETDTKPAQSHSKGAASDALSLLHSPPAGDAALSAQGAASLLAAGMHQQPAAQRTTKDGDRTATAKDTSSADVHGQAGDATVAADTDTSGRTFKLARADGRGQALEMSVGKGRDEAAEFDVRSSGSSGAETVTVLDSRRYLGLAPGSNSAAVIGAMGGDSEWSSAMEPSSSLSNAASWTSTGKVVNTLKIQMNPADLGMVTATMRLSGDELTVDLKVQSGEAYRQLHNDQGAMVDALRAQGYAVDRITVTLAAPPQTDSNTQSGFQGQPQQQSLPNQGQQGGEAQTRGQNYSGQRANGNDSGWGTGEPGVEDNASGGSQRGRPGGVYL